MDKKEKNEYFRKNLYFPNDNRLRDDSLFIKFLFEYPLI